MATFPIKVEKPEMKIMGLNILPMVVKVNKMMPEGMRKKSVVKQVSTIISILPLSVHRMASANLNKSKFFLTFTNQSIRAHTQDAQNLYQLRTLSPFSDPNLLSKSTFKCEHCEKRFTSQKTIFGKSMK